MNTITNEFHNTTANFKAGEDGTISRKVWLRISKELCGFSDCRCGGAKMRPADQWEERFIAVEK